MKYLALTTSDYINRKYSEFYEKHGYILEMFNPYNCCEIKDISQTITASCGGAAMLEVS